MKRLLNVRYMFGIWSMVVLMAISNKTPDVPTGPYPLIYPAYFGNRINVRPDNQLTRQGVFLGRMLFYERLLSVNNQVSCATCHQQKLAFTDGNAFSKGIGETPTTRSSMSLANLLWVRSFFWDGRSKGMEEQVRESIMHADEMGESLEHVADKLQQTGVYPNLFRLAFGSDSITGDRIAKAIAQFERTLISANSRYDQYLQHAYTLSPSESRGLSLFFTGPSPEKGIRGANCGHCHEGPKMFGDVFHNNGLDSIPNDTGREKQTGMPNDRGRFRAVSLRNIALTAPYMHDGRFHSLEEVVDHYSEHIRASATLSPFLQASSDMSGEKSLRLNPLEKKDLISFLHLLTDSTFITDLMFSNPHSY